MVQCYFCRSSKDIVKSGFRLNASSKKQRYRCNSCNHLFVPDDGFWKMKYGPEIIAEALSCKKRGMPYEEVSKHFREYNKANICPATAFNWVKKYGKSLQEFNQRQNPNLSGKINSDEFIFKVKKKEMLPMGKQRQKNKVQNKRFLVEKKRLRARSKKSFQRH